MGDDEYHAMSKKGTNLTEAGGIGYTVIDSIDTMLIMGLEEDYQRARQWVETKLSFEKDGVFNTFEVCFSSICKPCPLTCSIDNYPCPRWSSLCLPPLW